MAIVLRSRQQIEKLRTAGRLVYETFELLRPHVVPGVQTAELDRMAEKFVRSRGAKPAYKGYRGASAKNPFPATLCISPNNVICHGFPSKQPLKEGDIVGIDMGVLLDGWYGDACITLPVGKVEPHVQKLLDVAQECMWRGIHAAHDNAHMGDIGAAIQEYAESHGFSVVREYTGHGVGTKLHDDPSVAHHGKRHTGIRLRKGMTFTIEPMINSGRAETALDQFDGWTVRTADGSLSAQFEHTIAITDGEPDILTLPK